MHRFLTLDPYDAGLHIADSERKVTDWRRFESLVVDKGLMGRLNRMAECAVLKFRHL